MFVYLFMNECKQTNKHRNHQSDLSIHDLLLYALISSIFNDKSSSVD